LDRHYDTLGYTDRDRRQGMAVEVALKERLVGAVVLVALGVWLIPLFLDGGEREDATTGSRPLTLPVPAAATPDRTTKTIRLTNDTPSPQPAARTATTPAPAVKTVPSEATVTQPTPTSKSAQTSPTPTTSTSGGAGWFVQLGSFGSEANAKRLAAEVKALGWDAQLSRHAAGGKTMHRVRVGPLPTRSKADARRAELAQRGFAGKVMNEP
jgi:DedD protein